MTDSDNTIQNRPDVLTASAVMFLKGALIGLVIIMPGISGGTMILVLGLYERLMKDLSRLKLLPWIPLAVGMGFGLIVSGWLFAWLFNTYTGVIAGFLLGCILGSVKAVLGENYKLTVSRGLILLFGLVIGIVLAAGATIGLEDPLPPNPAFLALGGAIASAAMILPGVPGGSVLIVMGLFDDVMRALAALDWAILSIYAAGSVAGMLALSNVVSRIYARHRDILSWLFAGLVIGSGKTLLDVGVDRPLFFVVMTILGFAFVWRFSTRK